MSSRVASPGPSMAYRRAMSSRPAAGGGRWVEVDPGRVARWVEGFTDRHGPPATTVQEYGLLLTAGLFLIVMPTSALLLTRTGNFALERGVRWGILAVAAIALLSFVDLSS